MGSDKSYIDKTFIRQFEADVHLSYQQMGTKLRSTVRTKTGVVGMSTTFQKIGKGTAATKSRHGIVPVMNLNHEPVECVLQDYYAGDWVDALDELKTNVDERRVVASAGAYALGRKTDELIINALESCTNEIKECANYKETIIKMIVELNSKDVPDDGRRFCVMNGEKWKKLLEVEEFYSCLDESTSTFSFLGVTFILHNMTKNIIMWHSSAIGHACGQEVNTDISWHGERASHFISNSMSQGACLIDNDGVVKVKEN